MEIKRIVEASDDLIDIYLYTFHEYGKSQAEKYIGELDVAIDFIG